MDKKDYKTLSVIIDSSKLDIKHTNKTDLSQFNLQEIRGWIIDQLNEIEQKIDLIISNFFKPEKETQFRNIILNSSIISTGAKLKILKNIPGIENTLISKIQKISSIRNAFAHVPMTMSSSIIFERNSAGELESKVLNITSELAVMNSSGEIKNSSVKALLEEFQKICNEINPILNNVLEK